MNDINHVYRFVARVNRKAFPLLKKKPYSIVNYDNKVYGIKCYNTLVALSIHRKLTVMYDALNRHTKNIVQDGHDEYLEVETLDRNHFKKVCDLWEAHYKPIKQNKVENQLTLWCNDTNVPYGNNNSAKDVITHDDKYISVLIHFNTVIAVKYHDNKIMLLDSKKSRSTSRRCNMLFHIAVNNGMEVYMVSKRELDDYMLGLYLRAKKVISQ